MKQSIDSYETAIIFGARSKEYGQQNAGLWNNYATHCLHSQILICFYISIWQHCLFSVFLVLLHVVLMLFWLLAASNNTVFFPGDEGGESELLGEALPLEPSVAKAERSHLIVWQVMCGSEWGCRMQLETLKMGGWGGGWGRKEKKKASACFFFILWTCFTTWCWSISLLLNFILQICHTFSYTELACAVLLHPC